MKYTNKQKLSLRKSLKAIGYGCKIQEIRSPFSDRTVTFISFILPDKKIVNVTVANVYGEAFYRDHKPAFELVNLFIDNNGDI